MLTCCGTRRFRADGGIRAKAVGRGAVLPGVRGLQRERGRGVARRGGSGGSTGATGGTGGPTDGPPIVLDAGVVQPGTVRMVVPAYWDPGPAVAADHRRGADGRDDHLQSGQRPGDGDQAGLHGGDRAGAGRRHQGARLRLDPVRRAGRGGHRRRRERLLRALFTVGDLLRGGADGRHLRHAAGGVSAAHRRWRSRTIRRPTWRSAPASARRSSRSPT